jgi:hypothetical protein
VRRKVLPLVDDSGGCRMTLLFFSGIIETADVFLFI